MCQMSVVIDRDGVEELVMEDVTTLEVEPGGMKVSTMFDAPKLLEQVAIRSIDFLGGKVFLKPLNE